MSAYQVWLITGASKGLGYTLAKALLENNQAVAATARNPSTLESLAQYAKDSAKFLALKLDITSDSEIKTAFDDAVKHFGRINVVFSGAGAGTIGEVESLSYADIQSQIDLGLTGPVNVTRYSVALFREQWESGKFPHGGGTLLQVTSVGCMIPSPGLSIYQGCKAGVEQFMNAAARELNPKWGINMFTIRPAGFQTEWAKGSMQFKEGIPAYNEVMEPYRERKDMLNDPIKFANLFVDWNKQVIEYEGLEETNNGWKKIIKDVCPNEVGTGFNGGITLGIEGYTFIKKIFDAGSENMPKQRETALLTLRDSVDLEAFMERLKNY